MTSNSREEKAASVRKSSVTTNASHGSSCPATAAERGDNEVSLSCFLAGTLHLVRVDDGEPSRQRVRRIVDRNQFRSHSQDSVQCQASGAPARIGRVVSADSESVFTLGCHVRRSFLL